MKYLYTAQDFYLKDLWMYCSDGCDLHDEGLIYSQTGPIPEELEAPL